MLKRTSTLSFNIVHYLKFINVITNLQKQQLHCNHILKMYLASSNGNGKIFDILGMFSFLSAKFLGGTKGVLLLKCVAPGLQCCGLKLMLPMCWIMCNTFRNKNHSNVIFILSIHPFTNTNTLFCTGHEGRLEPSLAFVHNVPYKILYI